MCVYHESGDHTLHRQCNYRTVQKLIMADSEATKSKKRYSKKRVAEILADYRLVRISREMSILGRREVLSGKAKFGIFGDGKEVPQIAKIGRASCRERVEIEEGAGDVENMT